MQGREQTATTEEDPQVPNMQHTSGTHATAPHIILARDANSLPHTKVCAKTHHWWHTRKNPPTSPPACVHVMCMHSHQGRQPLGLRHLRGQSLQATLACPARTHALKLPKTPDSPLWT